MTLQFREINSHQFLDFQRHSSEKERFKIIIFSLLCVLEGVYKHSKIVWVTNIPKLYGLLVYSVMYIPGDSVSRVSFGTKIQ